MKKGVILFLLLLLVLLTVPIHCKEQPENKSGWSYTSQGTFYLDESAVPLTGWQRIDGNRYYFHPNRGGVMVCGWLELPDGRYYFDSTGIMQTGWLQVGGQQYYLRPDGAMAVGTLQIAGKDWHFTASGEPFFLVNSDYPVPDDYQPELVDLEGFQVSKDCAGDLLAMMGACRAAGHRCDINSAYRDIAFQQMLWDNRYNSYIAQGYTSAAAAELTAQIVLPPGYSEHHTGLAVDITGTEQMYSWLAQHAPEYGFILRYPEGKTDWTGVTYEPWHFRYVGRKLALELQSLNLTPEEYLHRLTEASRSAG